MSAKEMLLEQANTRLQFQRDLLWAALDGLRNTECFCEMSIGNPMFREHPEACKKATFALSVIREDFVTTLIGSGNQPSSAERAPTTGRSK